MRIKVFGGALLINIAIFSFLPVLNHFFHKPPSQIKPIQVDLIKIDREKIKPKKKRKPKDIKKLVKKKITIKPKLRKRIAFELDPSALASEVDLIAPMVTYDLSDVDQLPVLLDYKEPEYPEEAVTRGIEGVVVLKILIDRKGKVAMVKVIDNGGFYGFGRSASKTVRRWFFEPARIMGMPVAVWCIQSVRFELKE